MKADAEKTFDVCAMLLDYFEIFAGSEKARQYLADWNLKLPDTTIDLTARVLEPPLLFFGAQKTSYEEKADWSRTLSNSKVLVPVSPSCRF